MDLPLVLVFIRATACSDWRAKFKLELSCDLSQSIVVRTADQVLLTTTSSLHCDGAGYLNSNRNRNVHGRELLLKLFQQL